MKASKTLFSLMLLFLTLTMQAQKVSVSGQVLDSVTGEGIPFAGIFIKGTTTECRLMIREYLPLTSRKVTSCL